MQASQRCVHWFSSISVHVSWLWDGLFRPLLLRCRTGRSSFLASSTAAVFFARISNNFLVRRANVKCVRQALMFTRRPSRNDAHSHCRACRLCQPTHGRPSALSSILATGCKGFLSIHVGRLEKIAPFSIFRIPATLSIAVHLLHFEFWSVSTFRTSPATAYVLFVFAASLAYVLLVIGQSHTGGIRYNSFRALVFNVRGFYMSVWVVNMHAECGSHNGGQWEHQGLASFACRTTQLFESHHVPIFIVYVMKCIRR